MRIPPRVLWLCGCLAAFASLPAQAQVMPAGGMPAGGVFDAAPDYAFNGIEPISGMMQPPPEMMPMPGEAPYMNAYPGISPYYGPAVNSYYEEQGLWQNRQMFGQREYLFSIDYLKSTLARPGTDLIGARDVGVPQSDIVIPTNVGILGNGNDIPSDGLRAQFTILNPDTSSFEANVWWVAEGSQTAEPYGKGDPGDITSLHPRGVLGLDDGVGGTVVRYDTDFKIGYKSQAFGSDLNFVTMPFWETEMLKLRVVWGLKYVRPREYFSFHGEDSGLIYSFSRTTQQPIPGTVIDNPLGLPPFSSDLVSQTKSDIVGPELGVRYEIGAGKHFQIMGQTKGGVGVNNENILLYGNQIGDGLLTGFPTPTPADPKPSFFRHTQSHTHASPFFHQGFGFKGRVFQYVPVLNEWNVLADANLRLNYDFILVGEVARPTKIIDWKLDNPKIDLSRSRWYTQLFSVGLEWQF